jgi:polar amino acid transport system substrate-binding protein
MGEQRILSPARAIAAALAFGVLFVAGCGATGTAAKPAGSAAAGLGTIDAGKLKVAIEPYMPYTDMKDGRMVGLDAEILQAAAANLGLTIEPEMTDFKGMLNSVQSGRADVTIGGIGWSAERAEKGLFTDPVYYSPAAMAVVGNKTYKTVDDLKGLRLGTVSGYVWEQSIKAVPGAQAKVYPDANGFFADLTAGRIDVGFIDPLLVTYQRQVKPSSQLQLAYLTPPTDAQIAAIPAYKYFRQIQVAFYLPKSATKLERALDGQIDKLYQNGQLAAMVTKWGGDPTQFGKPDPYLETLRPGVDRPAGWKLPTI